ncbi:MAG: plasminogen-binding N-terminal domain-containing protein [Sulfurospirillaceae bacterium]|nr:plasminogen-binding N-terminal domain-containing protein [Sulfurospirillaceae bacterium]
MRKAILILSIIFSVLNANGLYNEFKTNVIGINGNHVTIKNSKDFTIGSTGIIIHKFDKSTSSIISSVRVINKSGDTATLKIKNYIGLKQNSLPRSGITPQVGDEVIINYLYDRALIVAPNYKVYSEIINKYKNITWVNPDIPASFLAKMYRPNPDKKLFQQMCSQNAASLILFAMDDALYFVDCNDFKVVKKDKAFPIKNFQVPFYSRVKNIDSSMFEFGSSKIDSYLDYYKALIKNGGENSESGYSIFSRITNIGTTSNDNNSSEKDTPFNLYNYLKTKMK